MDNALSPVDILVALKLAAHDSEPATLRGLADELALSKSAIANSIRSLRALDLVKDDGGGNRRVNKLALRACLEHAVRWIAPARVGNFELGLPTAHASVGFGERFTGDEDPVIMPLPHGPMRGRTVSPLHPLAPRAASRDAKLHRLLALVDSFRIGGAREREAAAVELRACL